MYLVDNLRANVFIGINIIDLKNINLNILNTEITFRIYDNIIIFLVTKSRSNEFVRRSIYLTITIIIFIKIYRIIFIDKRDEKILNLSINRNLFFEPNTLNYLDIYIYIVDIIIIQIFIKNDTKNKIKLNKKIKLKYLTEYNINEYYSISPEKSQFAIKPAKYEIIKKTLKTILLATAIFIELTVKKTQLFNKIIIYGNENVATKLINITNLYPKL